MRREHHGLAADLTLDHRAGFNDDVTWRPAVDDGNRCRLQTRGNVTKRLQRNRAAS